MKLSVNTQNLFKNLSTVFTDQTKVISELVQNGRRAGATRVSIDCTKADDGSCDLVIEDNGSGITQWNTLVTLADSCWSEGVTVDENPYGMGFFSTLFCCSSVIVESINHQLVIDTKMALAGESFGDIVNLDVPVAGTRITLKNCASGLVNITNSFNFEQRYHHSSVEIVVNGKSIDRVFSYDRLAAQYPVLDTPFGKLVQRSPYAGFTKIVVQEMCIGHCGTNGPGVKDCNILFANNTIQARMPDRDSILNMDDVSKSITGWLNAYHAQELAVALKTMGDEAFVKTYFSEVCHYNKKLLLTIDVLPQSAFVKAEYPSFREPNHINVVDQPLIRKSDFMNKATAPIVYQCAADIYSGEFAMAMFLHKAGAISINWNTSLPTGHWIFDCMEEFSESDFEVVAVGSPKAFTVSLDWIYGCEVVAIDSFSIEHKPSKRTVEVLNSGLNLRDSSALRVGFPESASVLVTPNFDVAGLLLQLNAYTDDSDNYAEKEFELDQSSFYRQYRAATGADLCEVLADMMGDLPQTVLQAVQGKEFKVKLIEGVLTFSEVA